MVKTEWVLSSVQKVNISRSRIWPAPAIAPATGGDVVSIDETENQRVILAVLIVGILFLTSYFVLSLELAQARRKLRLASDKLEAVQKELGPI